MIVVYTYNISLMREPYTDPIWDRWKQLIPIVHHQAADTPGFIANLDGTENPDGYLAPYKKDNPLIMGNLSQWTNLKTLREFTYGPNTHGMLMRSALRRALFDHWPEGMVSHVMWWAPAGKFNISVAKKKMDQLQGCDSSGEVFGWKQ